LLTQRDEIVAERQRVFDELNRIEGLKAYPSWTNFILFDTPFEDSRPILQALAERDIFIRRPGNPGLEHTLRVSIGTREENTAFLDALTTIMASKQEGPSE
jgi:histidinol-phosphate aminotransferase